MAEFIDRVVTWPGEDAPGHVNLHIASVKDDGKKFWWGKPYRTKHEFYAGLEYFKSLPGPNDIYFCTSVQAKATTNKAGKPKAERLKQNALSLRALFMDIDAKGGADSYPTIQDATKALADFLAEINFPLPSLIVKSGAKGRHVYWPLTRAVSPGDWQVLADALKNAALAEGLKFDLGCTTDSARILRLPGTLNHKTNPPAKVELVLNATTDFDPDELLKILSPWVSSAPINTSSSLDPSIWITNTLPAGFVMEKAGDGLDPRDEIELDFGLIAGPGGCPFFRKTFDTEGKHNANPLWNLTTLASVFMGDNGRRIAHVLSSGHSGYDHSQTDELFARKDDERRTRGVGWPSCRSFETNGCKECATCPHRGTIKSPLNLGNVPKSATPQVTSGPGARMLHQTVPAANVSEDMLVPPGYGLDKDGIHYRRRFKEGEEVGQQPLFVTAVFDPYASKTPQRGLYFTTVAELGSTRKVFIDAEMLLSDERNKILLRQGVTMNSDNVGYVGGFLMSWMAMCEKLKGSINARPFGWIEYQDKVEHAFVYGGYQWNYDGTTDNAGYIEPAFKSVYEPKGTADPWFVAAKDFVFAQKRPELEALLATAFAAPLMTFTAQKGGLFAVRGPSGAGKSSTIAVALGVWSCPGKTKDVLSSTANSVMHKAGKLGNLPLYWDEIREPPDQKQLLHVAFGLNEGLEKGRMIDGQRAQVRNSWATMIISGSNLCLYDHITEVQKSTDAGLNRVFEYEIKKEKEHMHFSDINQMIKKLDHNYGVVGLEYAKLLAENSPYLEKRVNDMVHHYGKIGDGSQRIWMAIAAADMVGAQLANELFVRMGRPDVCFDLEALDKFLRETLAASLKKVYSEANDTRSQINIFETLNGFLRANTAYTLATDIASSSKSDRKLMVKILQQPSVMGDKKPVYVHWVKRNRQLRISRGRFIDWMTATKHPGRSSVIEGFEREFNMTVFSGKMAAHTPYVMAQERQMVFNIPPGSELDEILQMMCAGAGDGLPGNGLPEPVNPKEETHGVEVASGVEQRGQGGSADLPNGQPRQGVRSDPAGQNSVSVSEHSNGAHRWSDADWVAGRNQHDGGNVDDNPGAEHQDRPLDRSAREFDISNRQIRNDAGLA